MFTGGFKESNGKEIILNDMEPDAVEQLIDYMYTSELKITEDNVQGILMVSNFLLIEEVDSECIKFMKENTTVKNCLTFKNFASSNNVVELDDYCLAFILDHFCEIPSSSDFLLVPFDLLFEVLQSSQLNVKEEKVYESIILWTKYELKSRLEFLPDLMELVNMSLVPVSYFINIIEKEEILNSNCTHIKYNALLMYTLRYNDGCPIAPKQRRYGNQLILITSWKKKKNTLEWMQTGNKVIRPTEFTWTTFNSIILSDGRIFRVTYSSDDNNWYGSIYSDDEWNCIGNFKFDQGLKEMLRLVELNECIYVMSHYGYFKCYNMKKNTWEDQERLNVYGDSLRGLTTYNGHIYSVNATSVSRFDTDSKSWIAIKACRQPQKIFYSTICSLDGFLYEIGGMRHDGVHLKSAMRFDLTTHTWSEIADMNCVRKNAGVVAVNGLIYVIGGDNCNKFETYNPLSNKWTLSDSKLKTHGHIITRAFLISPNSNIGPDNFSKYYPGSKETDDELSNSQNKPE